MREAQGLVVIATRWSTARSSTSPPSAISPASSTRRSSASAAGEQNITEARLREDIARDADPAPAARPDRARRARARGRRARICRSCCSSGGAARSASCRPALIGAGHQPDRRRDRRLLPAQPRRLHHARAAGDPICGDRPRAGRQRRRATEAEIAAGLPQQRRAIGAARDPDAAVDRAADASAGGRRPSPSACAAAPASPTPPRRPASPPPTSPSPTRRREQFAGVDQRRRSPRRPSPPRRAAVVGPIRSRARLPRRPGRADHARRRRGRSKRCAPRSPRAIERRKRTDALDALVTRIEEQLADGAQLRGGRARRAARPSSPRRRSPPRGRPPTASPGRRRPSSRRCCAPPSRSTPRIPSRWSRRSQAERALRPARRRAGRARRAAAARPDPRPGPRRVDPASARSAARAPLADAIAARINGGTPRRPRLRRGAAAACPPPEQVDLRRLDISRSGQQAPPPLHRPVQPAAGPRAGGRGAEQCRLVHRRRPRAAHARRRRRATPQLIDPTRSRVQPDGERGDRPSNSPARWSCGATSRATRRRSAPSAAHCRARRRAANKPPRGR